MFRRIDAAEPAGRPVRLTVDGVPLACREGDSVAGEGGPAAGQASSADGGRDGDRAA